MNLYLCAVIALEAVILATLLKPILEKTPSGKPCSTLVTCPASICDLVYWGIYVPFQCRDAFMRSG